MRTGRGIAAGVVALALACSSKPPVSDVEPTLAEKMKALAPAEQVAALRAMAATDSADANVAFLTGNAYYELGSTVPTGQTVQALAYFDTAVAEYQRAVRIDSTMSKAWVNMGLAYEGKSLRNEARAAFESAIAANPGDVLAYSHLGYVEQQSGNVAEAIRLYRQALTIDPDNAQAHYNLGLAFAEAKVFQEALLEWEKVARLDPDGELGKTAAENAKIIRQYLAAPQ